MEHDPSCPRPRDHCESATDADQVTVNITKDHKGRAVYKNRANRAILGGKGEVPGATDN